MNQRRGFKTKPARITYLKKHYLRYIYCVRIVTNCFVTPDIVRCFDTEEYNDILSKYIEFFQFFHDWNTQKYNLFG